MAEGLSNVQGLEVTFEYGCAINDSNTAGFAAAIEAALVADYAIFVGGIDNSIESEGGDRISIEMPATQLQLLQEIQKVQPNTVLVVVGGSSVDISWAAQHLPAIVYAFYPSEEGGNALADIITGEYNPSGRLSITLYPSAYVDQINMGDMNMRDGPGRTYRFYTGDAAVYPFGFGLSYTSFEYSIVATGTAGSMFTYKYVVWMVGCRCCVDLFAVLMI